MPIDAPADRGAPSRLLRRLRHGRPRLHGTVSHSRTLGMVAVTHASPVGIDVEDLEAGRDWLRLAPDQMAPAELADFRLCPLSDRPAVFLRSWTAKEAVLKATGLGLALSPRTIVVAAAADGALRLRTVPALLGRLLDWHLAVLDAGEGRVATLAVVASSPPRIVYRDWSRSASRRASATMVRVGLANPAAGKTEFPVT
jgi:4'-phosphopantetheinyl transferase